MLRVGCLTKYIFFKLILLRFLTLIMDEIKLQDFFKTFIHYQR